MIIIIAMKRTRPFTKTGAMTKRIEGLTETKGSGFLWKGLVEVLTENICQCSRGSKVGVTSQGFCVHEPLECKKSCSVISQELHMSAAAPAL